ncbi:MAG TPA: cupin domain-containing protein [Pseudonocardiaceae bacterium]|nr:cupin domain-containing protein [Pseudonocardiaceae bacterium]
MPRFLCALLCAAIVAVVPVFAWATPASGVSGTVLGKGTSIETIKVKNDGPTDIVVHHIVIEPGGSTGWHYHPGELIAVVHKGTLTRTLHDCSVHTNPAGQSFVELAGQKDVHVGRNLGTESVELYVTYAIPAGAPLSIDAVDPGC